MFSFFFQTSCGKKYCHLCMEFKTTEYELLKRAAGVLLELNKVSWSTSLKHSLSLTACRHEKRKDVFLCKWKNLKAHPSFLSILKWCWFIVQQLTYKIHTHTYILYMKMINKKRSEYLFMKSSLFIFTSWWVLESFHGLEVTWQPSAN